MPQRPRNRQGRNGQTSQRGIGNRGGRGQGENIPSSSSNVPSAHQVVTGAHVSIILKIDQPTGRQVQGTVAEILTSGDHHRGVKVRLADGRVGRVQRVVTEAEARVGTESLSRNSGNLSTSIRPALYHDFREDKAPSGFSLADFFPPDSSPSDEMGERSSCEQIAEHSEIASSNSAIQVCPVCYEFEGDEVAVAHHVNSHFNEM
ncbi:hypothetical protein BDP27DRAFT_1319446 [Rhodocollybia butyracea]|uniref:UBZ4-type domain-containing protein n=1 Tax=Rhodocollybia butyracea TaxID=206335 RepID=A0A9P5UAJ1_9AGAR|nr:hypothetical protein BDP27DRAFT_1319446 [Rhodocollybia butyracea]